MNNKKIRLNLYSNCFGYKKNHLGFKLEGILYCLTHSYCGNSVLVLNEELHMKNKSLNKQFLKPALNQNARLVNETNMFINKRFVFDNINKLKR